MKKQKGKKGEFSPKNLTWYENLVAGWPLLLLLCGGVGAACGGGAYYFNVKIFNSDIPQPYKYMFALMIGAGAVMIFLISIAILIAIFPGLVNK